MSTPGAALEWRPVPRSVRVIVNPAPLRRVPLLSILNHAFRKAGIRWDVDITHGDGDAATLARRAREDGADVIAVYGGDGTVMEAASALIGASTPLLILGGGTGNLVAAELRLPPAVEKACELICGERFAIRDIDVGMVNDRPFLLRAGCGLETEVVQDATRELKNQFGKWAYVFAGVKALQEATESEYRVVVDGREQASGRGVACMAANAGTVGVGRLTLSPQVGIDDGKLDVFFLKRANIEGIAELAAMMTGLDQVKVDGEPLLDASHMLSHWSASRVEVETDPVVDVQADGDIVSRTPMVVSIRPKSLHVVVPAGH